MKRYSKRIKVKKFWSIEYSSPEKWKNWWKYLGFWILHIHLRFSISDPLFSECQSHRSVIQLRNAHMYSHLYINKEWEDDNEVCIYNILIYQSHEPVELMKKRDCFLGLPVQWGWKNVTWHDKAFYTLMVFSDLCIHSRLQVNTCIQTRKVRSKYKYDSRGVYCRRVSLASLKAEICPARERAWESERNAEREGVVKLETTGRGSKLRVLRSFVSLALERFSETVVPRALRKVTTFPFFVSVSPFVFDSE